MNRNLKRSLIALAIAVPLCAWLLYFHNGIVTGVLPKWGWLQYSVARLGQQTAPDVPADEDPDNTKNEIPVHTAHVTTATLHRYIEGFGTVTPRPARHGEMAGSAGVAPAAAGVVAKVLCQVGDHVRAGDPLVQLDNRLVQAAQEQAAAALKQAEASLASLKAQPRPDQLQIAEVAVKKSQAAVDFAQKNLDRLKTLSAEQGVSAKSLEQAAQDLSGTQSDLTISQRQLDLVKNTPTPEDLAQEQAKVAQAAAAFSSAQAQRQMMTLVAPIDATVASISVNPGEPVDNTRVLVQLIALDRLMVTVNVPADQLPATAEGLSAEVLPASTGAAASQPAALVGKVTMISPQVDPRNGAVAVTIDLPGDMPTSLRPGLSVRVQVIAEEHHDVLAVPKEAVVTDENGDSVIATVEGEQATHKAVKVGLQENGLVEVSADGLKEGDTVVTAGAFGLPQATRVKVTD